MLFRSVLDRRGPASETVAMLVAPGARSVVVALGLLKAGKAVVALDPAHPLAHSRAILRESGAALLLTDRARGADARALADAAAEVLDVDARRPPPADARNPALALAPDTLAQVLFTSGSTGPPKGVAWTHRVLLHFALRTTNDLHLCREDRHTALRSVGFAGWTFDLVFALLNGASLHFFDLRVDGLGALPDWLEREDITMYRSAATVFRSFASQLTTRDRFPSLRVSVVTAEPVHARDVELFRRHFADSGLLCNELGMTEAGTVRSFLLSKDTPLANGRVPVGYPVEDVEILLLDPDGRPVEAGAIGEVVVRSRFLADGYWRRPELTATRFRPDPGGGAERLYFSGDLGMMLPDGCLVHYGRQDFQVKVRGHRVEIEDVEAALVALPGVRTAAVVASEDALGDTHLVAYIVPAGEPAHGVTALREALAASVPDHMIPATFVRLDTMPLTTGGKVDRRALPAPPTTRPALAGPPVAPRTPLEAMLTRIWTEVLELGEIGVLDDFLELGGDSLRAGQIVARVRAEVDVPISEATLFDAPTVEAMAIQIQLSLLDSTT